MTRNKLFCSLIFGFNLSLHFCDVPGIRLNWHLTASKQFLRDKNPSSFEVFAFIMDFAAFVNNLSVSLWICYLIYDFERIMDNVPRALPRMVLVVVTLIIMQNVICFPNRCIESLPLPIRNFTAKAIQAFYQALKNMEQLEAAKEAKDQWDFSHRYLQNGPLPEDLKERDSKINSNGRCAVCWEGLGEQHNHEVLLICGHRFHSHCLREWETNQYKTTKMEFCLHPFNQFSNENVDYRCPNCRHCYKWTQKWAGNLKLQ